jgi:branched-chain amino acid transport system permease protein
MTTVSMTLEEDRADTRPVWVRANVRFSLVALAVVVILPFVSPNYYLVRYNFTLIAIVGAVALNLLTGVAGQVSVGTAAFLAIGGYTSAAIGRSLGLGILVGVPLAAITSAVVGLLIGIPSLRFRGFYLALTTLALNFIVIYLAYEYQLHAGGLSGIPISTQHIGPVDLNSEATWYWVLALVVLVVVVASMNIVRSSLGRAWTAVRDHDIAAAMIGVNVVRYKLLAFTFSAFLTGIAGSLSAYHLGIISSDSFDLNLSIQYIAMIIIGGLGSTAGAVIGAIIVTQLNYVINSVVNVLPIPNSATLSIFDVQSAAFGLIIVLFLIFEPRGVIHIWARFRDWLTGRVSRRPTVAERSG